MSDAILVTAPLSVDVLKDLFLRKERSIIVDYDNSTLKGEPLFRYLSSLNVDFELKFGRAEFTMEALEVWLSSTVLRPCKCMEELAIIVLGGYTDTPGCPLTRHCLPTDWLERNSKVLDRYVNLIASMPVFAQSTIVNADWDRRQFGVDDALDIDPRVGINIATLLHHPEFWLIDGSKGKPSYFESLFEDSCYNGNNLFKYWQNKNNPIYTLSIAISAPDFNPVNFVTALEEGENHVASV